MTLATSGRGWRNRSALASECGIAPSTLSNALSGTYGLSEESSRRITDTLGVAPDAIWVPVAARSAWDRQAEEIEAITALRQDVVATINERADALFRAITARAQGD